MYRNLPIAYIDLMLTDLPRVEYGEGRITEEDIREAKIKDQQIQERMKSGKGIGANFKNRVKNNAEFLQNKVKK